MTEGEKKSLPDKPASPSQGGPALPSTSSGQDPLGRGELKAKRPGAATLGRSPSGRGGVPIIAAR